MQVPNQATKTMIVAAVLIQLQVKAIFSSYKRVFLLLESDMPLQKYLESCRTYIQGVSKKRNTFDLEYLKDGST